MSPLAADIRAMMTEYAAAKKEYNAAGLAAAGVTGSPS